MQGIEIYLQQYDVTMEELTWFVAMQVDANLFKAMAEDFEADSALEVYKLFQSVIYEFTKKKLKDLCQVKEFKALFTYYMESGAFEKFAQGDETLS